MNEYYEYTENKLKIFNTDRINELLTTCPVPKEQTVELVIANSEISDFSFIKTFPQLEKLSFLACRSSCWATLEGSKSIKGLRLHNLKEEKQFLSSVDFVSTFMSLENLYINMLGVSVFPNLNNITNLATVVGSFRNTNSIHETVDFSNLEQQINLSTFSYRMAVDRQKIPAESIIPIIKNKTISTLEVTQFYSRENKKIKSFIQELHPSLLNPLLSSRQLNQYIGSWFAW